MKSIEQLQKLLDNPYYTFTPEELEALGKSGTETPETNQIKKGDTHADAAPVKETGKLNKRNGDPVAG